MFFIVVTAAIIVSALVVALCIPWRRNKSGLRISGRHVLVTGCDCGIGREIAIQLDKMGVCVLATCLTKQGEQSLKSVTSDKLKTFQMDVRSSQQIEKVLEEVKALLDGKAGLWGLVNNAGVLSIGPVEWVSLDTYKKVADVNLWGLIDVTKTFLPLVKESKGRIVLVGSIAGVVSPQAFSPYCITKYGVEAFADSLRREMRPFGVHVSVIEPGATLTPILKEEVLEARLKEMWGNLPLEKQKEYGDEYFKAATKGFQDWSRSASRHINRVVDAIVCPLTSQFPKPRHVIGFDAWKLKISAHLPEVLQDLLLKDFPWKAAVPSIHDSSKFSRIRMNGSAS